MTRETQCRKRGSDPYQRRAASTAADRRTESDVRKLALTSLLLAGTATVAGSPAYAREWTYTGPHGRTVTHWGWGPGPHWGPGPCCYGAGVAAGAVAGLAVGTAVGVAAARPAYRPRSSMSLRPSSTRRRRWSMRPTCPEANSQQDDDVSLLSAAGAVPWERATPVRITIDDDTGGSMPAMTRKCPATASPVDAPGMPEKWPPSLVRLVGLGAILAVLAGCGARVANVASVTAGGPPPAAILVDVTTGPPTGDVQAKIVEDVAATLRSDLLRQLTAAQLAAQPFAPGTNHPDDAVLHVSITEAEPGSYFRAVHHRPRSWTY